MSGLTVIESSVPFLLIVTLAALRRWRNRFIMDPSGRISKDVFLPDDCSWLDQESFEVLSAICDGMIPNYHSELDCSQSLLQDELNAISPHLFSDCALTIDNLLRNRNVLLRGAIESRTNILVADALQSFSYRFDQQQLYILLRVLGTSLGCYLLCGIPVPLQRLPLKYREVALSRLRDSPLSDIRAAYQSFKRLTGNIFNAYAERGRVNPSWAFLQYNPNETVSKIPPPLQILDDGKDTYLRRKMRYESVVCDIGKSSAQCDTIDIDVVVIGSGAGGGTIAAQLVQAGLNVLVLEKGGYFRADDFREWRESEAMQHIYERSGLCTSADGNIVVLAGSCVGGGTTVNWSASFRTPQHIRDEWVQSGLTDFRQGGPFDSSLDAVHRLINVNTNCSHRTVQEDVVALCENADLSSKFAVNRNNQLLWEGAERLGFSPEKIPRNVKQCVDCGHCTHGCSYESKQSTVTSMMEPLLLQQNTSTQNKAMGTLHVIANCDVQRVLYDLLPPSSTANSLDSSHHTSPPTKKARGVEAVVTLYPESDLKATTRATEGDRVKLNRPKPTGTRNLRVNARIVICSAGAIHTPAVLLRSGFSHPMIGKGITLHPVLGAGGLFAKDVNTGLGSGVSMGVVVRNPQITTKTTFKNGVVTVDSKGAVEDKERYPIVIETPPVHPGLLGLMLPWKNGKQFKMSCLAWRNFGIFIAIPRDKSQLSNCVVINAQGQPVIKYKVTEHDKATMQAGFDVTLRLLYASGAQLIFIGHENHPWFVRRPLSNGEDVSSNARDNDKRFEEFLSGVKNEGIHESKSEVFSAHQMSSCRMSANPTDGCTRPTGELYECSHLYLADASVFPTSLGVNPMVTVEAMAHMIAGKVIDRLRNGTDTSEEVLREKIKLCRDNSSKNTTW